LGEPSDSPLTASPRACDLRRRIDFAHDLHLCSPNTLARRARPEDKAARNSTLFLSPF
jgi:hypothetical protein